MLAEMKAYAAQALNIDSLERQVQALQDELEATRASTVTLEQVKSWLTIGAGYAFLSDFGKSEVIKLFGEK